MPTNDLPPADAATTAAVRGVIEQYCEGARAGDLERVRETFHPDARMSGYLQGQPMVGTPEPFYDAIRNAPPPAKSGEPYRYEIVRVDVAGPVASVVLVEGPYLGMQFTEFFHLVKLDGRWRIVSKTFTHT